MNAFESFIENLPPAQQEWCLTIHDQLHEWLFPCQTAIKWDIPFFMHYGNLCFLNPVHSGEVIVGFMRGNELSDPAGLLVAKDRKLIRHLVITDIQDWFRPEVQELVLEAAALNEQYQKA